jgi:hypothetical protein
MKKDKEDVAASDLPYKRNFLFKENLSSENVEALHRIMDIGVNIEEFRNILAYMDMETTAWKKVSKVLRDAKEDPEISCSRDALDFLNLIEKLTNSTSGPVTSDTVLKPLVDILKSKNASHAASQKNQDARDFVLREWDAMTDKQGQKADFGRKYSALVMEKFGARVFPETISRDWLPKNKK